MVHVQKEKKQIASHFLSLHIGNIIKEYNDTHDRITDVSIEMHVFNNSTNVYVSHFCVQLTQIQGDDQFDTNMIEKQIAIFNMFLHNIKCNIDDTIYFQQSSSSCTCNKKNISNVSGIKISYCAEQQVIVITFKSTHHNFTISILSELCNGESLFE